MKDKITVLISDDNSEFDDIISYFDGQIWHIRFEDGGIEDYQCVEELINVLEIIFGGLENYNTMDDIKEILDVKEIIKYARKNC